MSIGPHTPAFLYFFFPEVFGPIIERFGHVPFLVAVILLGAAVTENVGFRQPRRLRLARMSDRTGPPSTVGAGGP